MRGKWPRDGEMKPPELEGEEKENGRRGALARTVQLFLLYLIVESSVICQSPRLPPSSFLLPRDFRLWLLFRLLRFLAFLFVPSPRKRTACPL